MSSEIDFSEGTPAKDPTNPIEFRSCHWRLIKLSEVEPDEFLELRKIFGVRREIRVGR
jgi:hypothetical protein